MDHSVPSVIVGLHVEQESPTFYLRIHREAAESPIAGGRVRALMDSRLEELEAKARALRDILASGDPETVEHMLCDATRVMITEIVLRPQDGRAAVSALLEHRFSPLGGPSDPEPRAS